MLSPKLFTNGDLGSWPTNRHKCVMVMMVNGGKIRRKVNKKEKVIHCIECAASRQRRALLSLEVAYTISRGEIAGHAAAGEV